MTPTSLVLIGGGEHARVVAEAARSSEKFVIAGFVDPKPCFEMTERLGIARLGGDEALTGMGATLAVLGVGAVGPSPVRRDVVERAAARVAGWAVVVHGTAWVSPTAHIAAGAVVMAGAMVNTGARIGRHCVVNTGAIVEHDVDLGDFAQLAPGVVVGGGVTIGPDAFVGLGAQVRDHIRIGRGAFVGMGALVVADVPDGAAVRGSPARIVRQMEGK